MNIVSLNFTGIKNIFTRENKKHSLGPKLKKQPDKDTVDFSQKQNADTGKVQKNSPKPATVKYLKEMDLQIEELKNAGLLPKDFNSVKPIIEIAEIDARLVDDLEKLYNAYKKNKDISEVFVKSFNSVKKATKQTETGDVCSIKGNKNAFIKAKDGTLKELKISAQDYLELFPPVVRFASRQQGMGDCYLVASLDSLYKNPNGRERILECFTKNADGSISVKFPMGITEFTKEKGKKVADYAELYYLSEVTDKNGVKKILPVIGKHKTRDDMLINGPEGLKMLEYLYGIERQEEIINKIMSPQYKKQEAIENELEDLKRILMFQKNIKAKDYKNRALVKSQFANLTSVSGVKFGDLANFDKLFDKYFPQGKTKDTISTKTFLNTYDICNDLINKLENIYEEIAEEKIELICNEAFSPETMRDRGNPINVYEKFGIKSELKYTGLITKNLRNGLTDAQKHIYTTSIVPFNHNGEEDIFELEIFLAGNKYGLKLNHEYHIEPLINNKGKILYKLTNPYNTGESVMFNEEEFGEYFYCMLETEI